MIKMKSNLGFAAVACASFMAIGHGNATSEEDVLVQNGVHYLEIVTLNAARSCEVLSAIHGTVCSDPIEDLGNARIVALSNGDRIGIREPLRDTETPIVRPYILVDNLEESVQRAMAAGAEFGMFPTEIAGHGTFAIYILDGSEYGLWQR